MKKIRVICSDPYATDCSSDDEESIEAKESTNGKQIVQEISVSIPTLHLDSLAELRSDSGTLSVQNELEKILMAQNCHSDGTDSSREDGPAKDGPICINQEDGIVSENNKNSERPKHPGLRYTASGKWGVQLIHPIEGTKMWFGAYNTIEEARVVCKKKKIEFAMLTDFFKKNNLDVLRTKHRREKIVVDDMTVLETVSGKWAAWTKDKASNVKLWLGLYTAPEEAMEAYRKKLEFDSNCTLESPGKGSSSMQGNPQDAVIASPIDTDKIGDTTSGVVNEETYFVHKEMSGRGASTEVVDSQGLRVRYMGIRLRQSGRWSAEIRDPRKRRRIHLGTYDTPEEAADVYNKKRLLFEVRMARDKKRKLKHGAEADDVCAMIKTEPNNASPSITLEAENSTVTAVGSQDSEGSNTNNDNQIPGSSLAAEDEFGFDVINRYGQFIGEYSRIDDELWII